MLYLTKPLMQGTPLLSGHWPVITKQWIPPEEKELCGTHGEKKNPKKQKKPLSYFLSTMSKEISDYMCGKYKILKCKSDKEKSNVKHFIKKQIRMW